MSSLTMRQAECLAWLKAYYMKHGYMATVRELAEDGMGGKTPKAGLDMLMALVKKGVIERVPGKARAMRFKEEARP